jgi:hypothetical protein
VTSPAPRGVDAAELERDLYRIDLTQVVSKFVGETEKNLELVFAAAESLDVVLLHRALAGRHSSRTSASNSRDPLHDGHFPGLTRRDGSNVNPHSLQRAGSIATR